ncbi:MAG: tetratricopeptide repeat protein [Gammaproteobacteria bacterium]|nr:tetratricopeptide repeat protein [Gammaproteobacteria bacterium]
MSELDTDDVQLEQLKLWWKENVTAVITGVVLGVGMLTGWYFWQEHQRKHAEDASIQYTHLMINMQAKSIETIPVTADILFKDYADTPYAALAGLGAAKVAVENSQESVAIERLQWVVSNAKQQHLKLIARLRLAELQLSQGQIEAAEKTVDVEYPAAYLGLLETLKGDIALAKADTDAAKKHYQAALNAKDSASDSALLKMKLEDLGVAETTAAVTDAAVKADETHAPDA